MDPYCLTQKTMEDLRAAAGSLATEMENFYSKNSFTQNVKNLFDFVIILNKRSGGNSRARLNEVLSCRTAKRIFSIKPSSRLSRSFDQKRLPFIT